MQYHLSLFIIFKQEIELGLKSSLSKFGFEINELPENIHSKSNNINSDCHVNENSETN